MIGPFGVGEILMIGAILVIVFSASRMGQLGNALGKFVYSFKKASRGDDLIEATPTLARGDTEAQVVEGTATPKR
jgi:sec-independent protein translocase protein TatA